MQENKINENNENLIYNDENNIQNIENETKSNQNDIIEPDKDTHTYENGDKFKGTLYDDGLPLDGIMTDKDGNKFYYIDGRKFENKFYSDANKKQLITVNEKEGGKIEGDFTNGKPFYATMIDEGGKFEGKVEIVEGELMLIEGRIAYTDGNVFEGKVDKVGTPVSGTLIYNIGSRFTGTFTSNDNKVVPFNGVITDKDGKLVHYVIDCNRFKGDVKQIYGKNIPVKGIMIDKNGNRFEGEFHENGKPAKGKIIYKNGNEFTGEVKQIGGKNIPVKGTMIDKNGNRDEGWFHENGELAKGKVICKNGYVLEGTFAENGNILYGIKTKANGNKFYYIDGRKFENKFYSDANKKQLITVNEKEGGKIEGEFTNGKPFYATMIDNNGNKSPATLRMVDGKIRILEGIIKYKDGAKFYGKLDECEAPSEGTMVYEQGSRYDRYIGTFKGWKKLKGKMFYRNGDKFEGTFKEGQLYNGILTSANKVDLFYYMDGVKLKVEEPVFVKKTFERNLIGGKFTCANGDKFEGEFKDNQISKGKFTYANGDVFEGTFIAGKPYDGRLTLENGNVLYYIDGFKLTVENPVFNEHLVFNDSRDIIRGKITFQNGNVFEGKFLYGEPYNGTMTYTNGDTFDGSFTMSRIPDVEQPLVPVNGKMIYANGRVFEGKFVDRKPHNGTMTYANGNVFEGKFDKHGTPLEGTMFYKNGDKAVGKFKRERLYTGLFSEKKWWGHTKYYRIFGGRYEVCSKKKKSCINSRDMFDGTFDEKNYSLSGTIFFKDGGKLLIDDTNGTDEIVDNYGNNTFKAYYQRPDGLVISGLFGGYDRMFALYNGVQTDLECKKMYYAANAQHFEEKQGFCILEINNNTTVRITKDGKYFLVPSDQKSGVSQDGTAHGEMFVMDNTLTEIYAIVEFDKDGKPIKATNNIGSNHLAENTLSGLQKFLGNRNYIDLISQELPKKISSLEDKKKQVQEEKKDKNEIIFEGNNEEEEEEMNLHHKKDDNKDKNEIIFEGEEEEEEMNLSSKKTDNDKSIIKTNEKSPLIDKTEIYENNKYKKEEDESKKNTKDKMIKNDNGISLKDDNKQKGKDNNQGIG